MLFDLSKEESSSLSADFLVIGGGTAGLLITSELAKRGASVICVESGAVTAPDGTHPDNSVEQIGLKYEGATSGRARCLGGTSTIWGGALIPFQGSDLDPKAWPISIDSINAYEQQLEEILGLDRSSDTDGDLKSPIDINFIPRLAKWPPFKNRNFWRLFRDRLTSAQNAQIWTNAAAAKFHATENHIHTVDCLSPNGNKLKVAATHIILAAGAIECTRLLLLIDRQNNGLIKQESPMLGEKFSDHLSAVVAKAIPLEKKRFNKLVGFRFGKHGTMRNVRFEMGNLSALRQKIPACFAHFAYKDIPGSPFDCLREFFRAAQKGAMPKMDVISGLLRGTPWIAKALWWRAVHKRLLYPSGASVEVHMVIDQTQTKECTIALSKTSTDRFGNPLAKITWNIDKKDISAVLAARDAFIAHWTQSEFAGIAKLTALPDEMIRKSIREGGGVYHPSGTTRMSIEAADGVVNSDLRLHAIENISVAATSVLPTGGGANPTMTLLMLALRLVDHLMNAKSSRTAAG